MANGGGGEAEGPVEWVGGSWVLTDVATKSGVPMEVLAWMGPDGTLVGTTFVPVGEGQVAAVAAASLGEAITAPMDSDPDPPERVRVASEELAAALRAGHPDLEVVCAPTPELDSILEQIRSILARRKGR